MDSFLSLCLMVFFFFSIIFSFCFISFHFILFLFLFCFIILLFIQLLDNTVDDDFQQHIRQQRLLHEFARHSAIEEENSGSRRWGKASKRSRRDPSMDYERYTT
jgi:ABC-type bacteriocin/lantibiotic exporter with double-glycine peptidase domain